MLCELCLTCKTYFYVLPQEQVARHVARRFVVRYVIRAVHPPGVSSSGSPYFEWVGGGPNVPVNLKSLALCIRTHRKA